MFLSAVLFCFFFQQRETSAESGTINEDIENCAANLYGDKTTSVGFSPGWQILEPGTHMYVDEGSGFNIRWKPCEAVAHG